MIKLRSVLSQKNRNITSVRVTDGCQETNVC